MKKVIILAGLISITHNLAAQKEIVNEEINITKEKNIVLPKSNRIFDKIPPIVNEKKEKELNYSFFDRKPTGIEEVKFSPNIITPTNKKNEETEVTSFNNYLKLGIGNFGRMFAETYINSAQNQQFIWGINALHNSTKRGPINNSLSASSQNKIGLDGKYHQQKFEVKLNLGYDRQAFQFYGFEPNNYIEYQKSDIRQILNFYSASATIENTNASSPVDYSLTTGIKSVNDYYHASESDWGTQFSSYFPIIEDKLTAFVDAEAYLTQRSDGYEVNPVRKRNLFRVVPSFRLDFGKFSAKIGFKAVNDYDQISQINTTKGYPVASISYKTPSLIYFFAGYDGDIVRNTLHSFLKENPFLNQQVNLLNTYKPNEFYVGSRGEIFNGFSYNAKFSYGTYDQLSYFVKHDGVLLNLDGNPVSTTKFDAEYETETINFANGTLEFGYSNFEWWKSNLKLDYYFYETKNFAKPFQRPNFVGKWGNTFTVSDKLVANLDYYLMTGLWAKDASLGTEPIKMKNISDLNAEITYLFSKHFSTFVKLNNILGKKYQLYYNYPQLGLNFMAGINIAL